MILKCLVVDDEPLAIQLLEDYISKTYFLELSFSTTNPLEALQKCDENHFDLIFLDIQMPEMNGMHFLKILEQKTKVILTTAYSDFAVESYDYEVADYLLKPISYDRFYKSVLKVKNNLEISPNKSTENTAEKDFFFVKSDGKQIKIHFQEILFIESLRDYVNIKTTTNEWIILENLKDLEEVLPKNIMRVHRSFIINLNKIESIEGNRVYIHKTTINIGYTYREKFRNWFDEQAFKNTKN